MGLGHFGGGVGAARWLAEQGAAVTITDLAGGEELARPLGELRDVPLAGVHLGGHRQEDFRHPRLVVVNPAVRPDNPFLQIARRGGARLATEIELFMEACAAPIIAVTGSNGKSTTAAMIAAVLRADGRPGHLGGNIGNSLLAELPRIDPHDWVVLELSSFQLAHLGAGMSIRGMSMPAAAMPRVAVVTNFSPNHLDWHGTLDDYRAAKQRLLTEQSSRGIAVLDTGLLNTGLLESDGWSDCVAGRLVPPLDRAKLPALQIPGAHNLRNAAMAAAAAAAAGCSQEAITRGLASFQTLPGRLQLVATIDGLQFYNDTSATTPQSTIAAVRSLDDGCSGTWIMAGGSDKGVELNDMAAAIVRHTCGAAFFGSTAQRLQQLTASRSNGFCTSVVKTLEEAFARCLESCRESSRAGQRILLSPGCGSLDQFQNFRRRGERFNELIAAIKNRPTSSRAKQAPLIH